ncbi:MAG: DUF460 domain-containing protein [Candidatus Hydrothermarchaeaceae archaeon]
MHKRILGIDISSGSPISKTSPRYSVALLDGNRFILKDEVSKDKLRRLVRELAPERIACDNILELSPKGELIRFFSYLPDSTRMVQVNGRPGKMEPLHVVAKRNGINITSRASSMEEAMTCARLASRNVGYEAKAFHDKSVITVSRARSLGRGGQSQDRYRRKVHNMVAANVRGIAGVLDERGVDYELKVVSADSGLSRGVFEVASSREKLSGIKQRKGPDVQIKIRPVAREKLEFVPLPEEKKSVILGVDPGLTVGLAVMDLDDNLLEVFSSRDFSLSDVLSYTTKYSDVAVVASDVTPAPKLVGKIAAALDAVVFAPSHALSVEEKISLIDGKFSREVYSNAHERDAVAAVIKACNSYRNKLVHVERRLEEMNLTYLRTGVRQLVLKGMSLDKAVKRLTEVREKPVKRQVREVIPDEHRAIIRTLREEISLLKSERDSISRELEGYKSRVRSLGKRLREVRGGEYKRLKKDKELRLKQKEIAHLKSELLKERKSREEQEGKLEALRRARLIELSDKLVVSKVLRNFTREEVLALRDGFREGEVLYIVDAGGGGKAAAEELERLKPVAVVADRNRMSHLARESLRKVPVVPPERLGIKLLGEVALVDKEALWAETEKERERIAAEERVRTGAWLREYIEKYRGERKR